MLLAIFVFCNTPVHILHTLFANHKDQKTEISIPDNSPEIYSSGINCHLNSHVVTAPYLAGMVSPKLPVPVYHINYHTSFNSFIAAQINHYLGLRAPPSLS